MMSGVPWGSKPPIDSPYEAIYHTMIAKEWEAFNAYYVRKRGLMEQLVEKALKDVYPTITQAEIDAQIVLIKQSVTSKDFTGRFGEIIGTYYLEHRQGSLMFGLTWPIVPFKVSRGEDLVGLCLERLFVIFVEAKATSDVKHLGTQVWNAREELKAARFLPAMQRGIDDGSGRRGAIAALRRALLEGKFKDRTIDMEKIEELVSGHRFVRIGIVAHPFRKEAYNYDDHLGKLLKDDLDHHGITVKEKEKEGEHAKLPTVFVDIDFHDYDETLSKWIKLELSRTRAEGSQKCPN